MENLLQQASSRGLLQSSSDNGSDSGNSTQTAFAVIGGVCALLVAVVVFVFYFLRDRAMNREILDMQKRFDEFRQEMQLEHQKRLFKYSKGAKEFIKQYKKPILQSAFDLQSRLTNQVKNNFLYSFLQERGGERDKNYALYNFSFVFAEFLGWMEVIRQELVFITGDDDMPLLASLIEGIKFQLTGETPVQGTAPKGKEGDPEFETHSKIFQLYAGELRSIGSVMIQVDSDGHKNIINADEFQRLMTVKAPPEAASEQAKIDWARSRERLFQDMMLPLFDHLRTMAQLPKGEAPIRRLAILQVLVAKLIDLVDNAVPWDSGPKYDPGEEPQYITRDFRLTPLVAYLNSHQRTWMASQLFMETADRFVADSMWDAHMDGRDATWRKLCFAGFREDLAHLPQDERDKRPDMWPGACPPRLYRKRPEGYNEKAGGGRAGRNTSLFMRASTTAKAGGPSYLRNETKSHILPNQVPSQLGASPSLVAAAQAAANTAARAQASASAAPPPPPSQQSQGPGSLGSRDVSGSGAAPVPNAAQGKDASGGTYQALTIGQQPPRETAAGPRALSNSSGSGSGGPAGGAGGGAGAPYGQQAAQDQAPGQQFSIQEGGPGGAGHAGGGSVQTLGSPIQARTSSQSAPAQRGSVPGLPPLPGNSEKPKPGSLPPLGNLRLRGSNRVEPEQPSAASTSQGQ